MQFAEGVLATKKVASKTTASKKATTESSAEPKKAPAKKAAAKAPAASAAKSAPSHAEIAKLAHKYYEERGGHHGSNVADWLRAEKELAGE